MLEDIRTDDASALGGHIRKRTVGKGSGDHTRLAFADDAVAKQIAAVEKLRDHGILDGLPDDLRMTGELRLQHDEASLSELASYHLPPISKSGLNHRLSRLMEMAEKLK